MQGFRAARDVADPEGPDVGAGIGRDGKRDHVCEGGAGNDAPPRAVPVLDQAVRSAEGVPHDPGVVRCWGGYSSQETIRRQIRALDDAPARAVPVRDKRGWRITHVGLTPDGPHVVAGRSGDGDQRIVDDGGGDDAPTRPIEVLGECRSRPAAITNNADRPDVVVSDRRGPEEYRTVDHRAGDDVEARPPEGRAGGAQYDSHGEQSRQFINSAPACVATKRDGKRPWGFSLLLNLGLDFIHSGFLHIGLMSK